MKNFILKKWGLYMLLLAPLYLLSQEEILVSDRVDNAVNLYDLQGNFIQVFIEPNAGGISNPQDILFHPNGNIIMTGLGNSALKEYDGSTGDYIGEFSSGYALSGPTRMELRQDDFIYVLQWTPNYTVVRFNLDGTFDEEFTNTGIFQSIGLAWDDSDILYVSSYGQGTNGIVKNFTTDGDEIGTFVDSSVLQGTTNIWFDPQGSGNLFALDFAANRMSRFDPDGNFIDHPITGIINPEGFLYLLNGNLLICERGANRITQYDANLGVIGRWDDPAGDLSQPNFIRMKEPNFSIPDFAFKRVLVSPTVGTLFSIDSSLTLEFKSLELYDLQGMLIKTIDLLDVNNFNAANFEEGLYILIAVSENGKKATQKIIIKK